jgi:hypothetical protein
MMKETEEKNDGNPKRNMGKMHEIQDMRYGYLLFGGVGSIIFLVFDT